MPHPGKARLNRDPGSLIKWSAFYLHGQQQEGVGTTRSLRLPPTPKPSVISGGLCQRHPTTHRLSPAPGCSDISWLPWLQTVPIATAESRDLITPPAQRRGHRQRRGAASPTLGPGPLPAALRRLPRPSQRDPTPPPTPITQGLSQPPRPQQLRIPQSRGKRSL